LLFAGTTTDFTSKYTQSEVSFNGVLGYDAIQFSGFFQVTPIPEPATWIGGALALAAVSYTQRRRLRSLVPRIALVEFMTWIKRSIPSCRIFLRAADHKRPSDAEQELDRVERPSVPPAECDGRRSSLQHLIGVIRVIRG
jgi:hypothetical protein